MKIPRTVLSKQIVSRWQETDKILTAIHFAKHPVNEYKYIYAPDIDSFGNGEFWVQLI